jgi:hypothetical protein
MLGATFKRTTHDLCLFKDLPTEEQERKDRQVYILNRGYLLTVECTIELGGARTCRNEVRAIEMPKYR